MVKGTRFTDRFIMNLKPAAKEYWIREGQGFSIRVLPSGEKSWYFIYTFERRKRYLKLLAGGYPDISLAVAREAFNIAKVKVKNGIDPITEKRQALEDRRLAPTISDLVFEYIERHAKQFKKSWRDDNRLLTKEVVPVWGNRKAEDIKKRDIILLLESIVDRGTPAMSNQVLKVTRKMFNFAVERDILQFTPFGGIKALAPNNRRERTLNEAEIKTFWKMLENAAISNDIKRALKLVLVTAQRPGEVTGMRVKEIEGRWWTIPPERAKNKREHRVYLTDMALDIIGDPSGREYIFPCPHKHKDKPIDSHALPVAVRRNLAWPQKDSNGKPLYNIDGTPATENKFAIKQFTPHDLRRTAATFLASLGFMDEIIDSILNHVKQGIIRTYNRHDYDKEKQHALESWEQKLICIINDTDSKVIRTVTET